MHRTVDPADGETYVAAYLGMDVAQKVFACFDQNDLKAPITTSVRGRPGLDGAGQRSRPSRTRSDGHWRFATTPPIPVALVVVAAGPWASVRWEHAGLPFGWHARASLAGELERDFDELRRITEACYDHFAEMFDEPYAVRLLRPGLRARPQLGRPGDARLRHLPRRDAPPRRRCPRTSGCSGPR